MVSPRVIKATMPALDNQPIMAFDAGYNYNWFIFNDSIPCNEDIESTSFFVLKDWK